jgi:signal transduction histidine kinase
MPQSGTGLGLSIVKSIIDRHEQNITAESTEGEGTTFTFTVKYAGAPAPQRWKAGAQ